MTLPRRAERGHHTREVTARISARRTMPLDRQYEKAPDVLEPLLKVPYDLSPGWLRIDPKFDLLRNNPRFQKLVAAK